MKLLHVDSIILGAASASRRLSAAVVGQWKLRNPGGEITSRDLAADPIAHFGGEVLTMRGLNPSEPTPEVRHALSVSATALEEFLAANIVVIGAPMYNFGIPSQLKAWIDRLLARRSLRPRDAGQPSSTFRRSISPQCLASLASPTSVFCGRRA